MTVCPNVRLSVDVVSDWILKWSISQGSALLLLQLLLLSSLQAQTISQDITQSMLPTNCSSVPYFPQKLFICYLYTLRTCNSGSFSNCKNWLHRSNNKKIMSAAKRRVTRTGISATELCCKFSCFEVRGIAYIFDKRYGKSEINWYFLLLLNKEG